MKMGNTEITIKEILPEHREQVIIILNQFTTYINSLALDGVFSIKKRFATKMTDIYLKLSGTKKVVFIGAFRKDTDELVSVLIARVEDKPFLKEEKVLFIDLAVTKKGREKNGYMGLLVNYTENWAKENSIQAIELRAITANEQALRYWESKKYSPFYIRYRKTL
jgi:hypothetical protein